MPKNQTIDSKKIQGNILVVLPKFIGDTINCTPAIKMLKTLYPNKKIYVLARPHLVEMLSRDHSIEVIADNRFNTHQPCSLLSQASLLKKVDIDLAPQKAAVPMAAHEYGATSIKSKNVT